MIGGPCSVASPGTLGEVAKLDAPARQERTAGLADWPSLLLPALAGLFGSLALAGLYLGIVGLAQDFPHALQLLKGDWYFTAPIALGFGIQVGLFTYVRRRRTCHVGSGRATALTGAGTGTSTVSMVACCAHHLTEFLPVLGLSGAALFLNEYRSPLMLFGILANAVGIVLMVRLLRRTNQNTALMADGNR